MTRTIEIIRNTLILQKQVLEQELEEIINSNNGKVGKRVDRGIEILKSISEVDSTQKTLDSYINNNNTE
tara:strand:- start:315 stop:521 length:207 start_codon:yes stop_codon:yes gene_type:complete